VSLPDVVIGERDILTGGWGTSYSALSGLLPSALTATAVLRSAWVSRARVSRVVRRGSSAPNASTRPGACRSSPDRWRSLVAWDSNRDPD